ncbi:hypothetical protein B0H13DRAFT_2330737 [Mycena leptocephala]|nr:hypothetical protein B0H13DRAFT_2330737 [Mycena leptocephala]
MVHVITPPPATATHEQVIWLAGPRFVGLLFNWALLGVLTTQVYIYHTNFPKDKRILKILVYLVYLLDWAQTCSATYDAFQWFIYGFGNIPNLYLRYTGFLNIPLLSSTIGAIIFYGWRIWSFSKSKTIFVLVCILALLQWSAGVVTAYYMFIDASETSKNPNLIHAVGVRLSGSAIVDTVIAVSMTYYLVRGRREALGPMNSFMTRLIRLTVETGTITVVAAILDLVFYLREHGNGLHQVSGVILGKMYSNAFLVLFNNRLVDWNKTPDSSAADRSMALAFRVGPESTATSDFPLNTVKSDKDSAEN